MPRIKLADLLLLTLLIVLAIRLLFSCCVIFFYFGTVNPTTVPLAGLKPDGCMQILALRYPEGRKAKDILVVYLIDENRHNLTKPFMDISCLNALYGMKKEI